MPVTNLQITSTVPFAGGQSFGDVGPYTHLKGRAYFSVDPDHPSNRPITDIELAPRDLNGRVPFSADFEMLQPKQLNRGRGSLLFDVVNRGRKTILGFNSSPRAMEPGAPLDPGNGFLMREGYTVVWCGWQADVPDDPHLIGLQAPQALNADGSPLTARILHQFQSNEPVNVFHLADRNHNPHPPTDPDDPGATLLVRDHPNGPATEIERDRFQFVRVEDEQVEPDLNHVYLKGGFEPGRIYPASVYHHGQRDSRTWDGVDAGHRVVPQVRVRRKPVRGQYRLRARIWGIPERAVSADLHLLRHEQRRSGAHGARRYHPARRGRHEGRVQPALRPTVQGRVLHHPGSCSHSRTPRSQTR